MGYGSGIEVEFSYGPESISFDRDGWFGGGFIGLNWPKDRFVFGIEGDANGADIEVFRRFGPVELGSKLDALFSIRGPHRLGARALARLRDRR